MSEPLTLQPLSFPLQGSRLIEASAGTGKTWTIASLYLRLVLGHGSADRGHEASTAYARPLGPAEILVMTFTRAATRELSDRIRARLIEAARHFRGEPSTKVPDDFILALEADYPEGQAREHAAWRLATAAEAMDEAAVMTIDAWCQRMLNEHAFDTGNPFDETLLAQDGRLIDEAIRDYWRQQGYPLQGEPLETVCAVWKDAEALAKSVAPLLRRSLDWQPDPRSLAECATQLVADERAALARLSEGWVERAQAMWDWYEREVTPSSKPWNRKSLMAKRFKGWTGTIADWARNPVSTKLGLTDKALARLTPDGIREAYTGDPTSLQLPSIFEEFAALREGLAALTGPGSGLRAHAAGRIVERLQQLKRQSRSFSFADMTKRLERALAGPQGERLRHRIISQYPVALIDEFQDTSPEQYRLFDALYRCADNDPRTALVLIGDPKQSIYGFRGADIHSYLKARRACAGRIYALDRNFRSTQEMVDAVNAWFGQAEARTDEGAINQGTDGAFRFRGRNDNPMPFFPVQAQGRPDRFRDGNGPIPALTIQHDLRLTSGARSRSAFAARCAERVVHWLNDPRVGFEAPDKGFQRLRPADIAVLVRDRHEAAAVRRALRKRGVASIFHSEQESVFASPEASDLLRWLRAVAAPGEVMLVRAALATRTLDLPFDQLSALAQDDDAYDLAAGQMRDLQKIWQTRGVLAMLRRTLHEFKCPARWLSSPDGERRLTNLLHLAELLQQASIEAQTDHELIQWLARRIDDSGEGPGEEQVLRLESDADLIQVITIHKSKGLEYPVVCLPFACSHRRIEERNKPAFVSVLDAGGERVLKLDCGPSDIEQADIERLREDLRLYYVALTRARHAVWMGFASLRHGNSKQCQTRHGAPGRLIAGSQALAESAWFDALKALSGFAERPNAGQEIATGALGPTQPCIVLEAAASHAASTMLNRTEPSPVLAAVRHYAAEFERWWAPGSYTSLTRDAGGSALAPTQARRPAEDEVQDLSEGQPPGPNPTPAANSDAAPWHRFPGGARGGDFVHGVLEWLTAEQFELAGKPRLEQALRDRCVRAGYPEHGEALVEWMHALLATELPGLGARLPQLRSRMCEMEFWMPAAALQSAEVDRLCRTHLLEGCERPALPHRTLNGMLMGFADLVFEHQGRYWVLDYKTNRPWADAIGRAAGGRAVYDRSSLAREMARHRYDVQAAVYLLALHRQLRARLGGAYDPRRQLGGAIYWFIRGIDGPVRGEYAIPADPGVIELLEQLDQQLGLEVEVLR